MRFSYYRTFPKISKRAPWKKNGKDKRQKLEGKGKTEMIRQEDWDFLSEESDLARKRFTNRKQSCRRYPFWTWKFRGKEWEHQKKDLQTILSPDQKQSGSCG